MRKRILSILLVAVMVLVVLPVNMLTSYATEMSGACGENLVWNFDETTFTLTISGEGPMDDFTLYTYDSLIIQLTSRYIITNINIRTYITFNNTIS